MLGWSPEPATWSQLSPHARDARQKSLRRLSRLSWGQPGQRVCWFIARFLLAECGARFPEQKNPDGTSPFGNAMDLYDYETSVWEVLIQVQVL